MCRAIYALFKASDLVFNVLKMFCRTPGHARLLCSADRGAASVQQDLSVVVPRSRLNGSDARQAEDFLCNDLKLLVTALTRAKQRVMFFEADESRRRGLWESAAGAAQLARALPEAQRGGSVFGSVF